MSKTPNYDSLVKAILDSTQPGERVCALTGEKWMMTEEEIDWYRKFNVPPIDVHPFMRMKLMAAWGTGVDLWWKPDYLTGKPILSAVHPDISAPVISDIEWYANDYGDKCSFEFDSALPFFSQLAKLANNVPMPAFDSSGSENTVGGGYMHCVNSFMIFGTWSAKDSFYVFRSKNIDRVVDGVCLEDCQDSFSSSMCFRINKCVQAFECIDCMNSAFVYDCRNCEDCFCSTNLRRRRFVFQNKQLSESEYRRRMSEIDLSCSSVFESWKKTFRDMIESDAVFPEYNNINSPECAGDYLADCLRSSGYFMSRVNNLHQGWFAFDMEDSAYVVIGNKSQNCWYSCVPNLSDNIKFSYVALSCQNCEYIINCHDCENCFGCVGLRRKKFCILNKQYSEEEYWRKLDEIKCAMLERGEYGKFMPLALSRRGADTGFSSIISPFTKDEIAKAGGLETDPIAGMRYAPYSKDTNTLDVSKVPDKLSEIDESWTKVQFEDSAERRRFSIPSYELAFRKEKGYPFPRKHYRARLIELFKQVNSPELEEVQCAKCGRKLTVNKNHMFKNRKVYCHDEYLKYLDEKN